MKVADVAESSISTSDGAAAIVLFTLMICSRPVVACRLSCCCVADDNGLFISIVLSLSPKSIWSTVMGCSTFRYTASGWSRRWNSFSFFDVGMLCRFSEFQASGRRSGAMRSEGGADNQHRPSQCGLELRAHMLMACLHLQRVNLGG